MILAAYHLVVYEHVGVHNVVRLATTLTKRIVRGIIRTAFGNCQLPATSSRSAERICKVIIKNTPRRRTVRLDSRK